MTPQQQLQAGYAHHRAGRLAEAEVIYHRVLAQHPNQIDALSLLAMLALQTSRFDAAAEYLRRAVQIKPDSAELQYNLSLALKNLGELDAAIAAARRAIQLKSNFTDAHVNLGNALMSAGKLSEAIGAFGEALRLKPDYAEVHNNLGNAMKDLGQLDEAAAAYSKAIALQPDWGIPRLSLGQILREQGRVADALAAFEQAARREPNSADAHNYLAMALADMQRLDEAAVASKRGAALAPDSALTHQARGTVLLRGGQGAQAIDHFRRAVEIEPRGISGWINLGQTLRLTGRFSEAADCYRQILIIQPGSIQAHALLAGVGVRPDPAELGRLTSSLDGSRLSPRERADLGFVLGSVLDEADRFDEAFAQYARANALVLQLRQSAGESYSSDIFARQVDDLIANLTSDFFAAARDWGEPSDLPVFVVGMPRSGTSLVEQIAASHPDVFGAGELTEIGDIADSLRGAAIEPGPIHDAAMRHLQRLHQLGGSASRVIDKMPGNVVYLGLIAMLFPAARVIVCRRDPRDNCLSCFFQNFGTGNLFTFDLAQCGLHHVQTDRLISHWLKALPLQILQVQYEDLVADLDGQARRIIDFLGLPWNPACLDFHRTDRTVQTASAWQVRQPIYTRSVGRWQNYRKHLGPLLESLGQSE